MEKQASLVFVSRLYYSARTRVDTLGGNAGGMALAASPVQRPRA